MKRTVSSLFAFLILCGFASAQNRVYVDRDERTYNSLEGRVIKTLFDCIGSSGLQNEKFGAIIFYSDERLINANTRQAMFLGWFHYSCDDLCITINYFIFPRWENVNELFESRKHKKIGENIRLSNGFNRFMQEIVDTKKINDTKKLKQLKTTLPTGLKTDDLLDKMHKIDPPMIDETGKPHTVMSAGEGDLYYWGFKSNNMELIRTGRNYTYLHKLMSQFEREILKPIQQVILEYETPEKWRQEMKEFIKARETKEDKAWLEEAKRKFFEERGTKSSLVSDPKAENAD